MLFYEPLFLTIFPAFYALYLAVSGDLSQGSGCCWSRARCSISGANRSSCSVLLVSTAHRLRAVVSPERSEPCPIRRLALAAGIAGNLAILIVYKYADFLAENFNCALTPFGAQRIAAVASGAADRRLLRGVRKDHLSASTPIAASRSLRRRSGTTACSCCSFRNCWPGRSSNITRCRTRSRSRGRSNGAISASASCGSRAASGASS